MHIHSLESSTKYTARKKKTSESVEERQNSHNQASLWHWQNGREEYQKDREKSLPLLLDVDIFFSFYNIQVRLEQ